MNTLTLNELMHKHGVTSRWGFSTYFRGVHARSPRTFDDIESALHAVMEKLKCHAIDGEYPMISLLALPERSTHTCEDV